MNLIFRQGTWDDLESVYQLNNRAFAESWSLDGLKGALADGYELLICNDGDRLAGYLLSHDVLDEVHIMQVVVESTHRRHGIAEQLSRNLLATKQGKRLLLEVRASNQAAQLLYSKLGFIQSGRRKAYYVPDHAGDVREDAILMHHQPTTDSTESIS